MSVTVRRTRTHISALVLTGGRSSQVAFPPPSSSTMSMAEATTAKQTPSATKPKKRFVGTKSSKQSKPGARPILSNQVPAEILQNEELNAAIKTLPAHYSFEIHKTIHHVKKNNATMVALQMPEGLQMFACTIADIIERCARHKSPLVN
jgi:2-(3-amino-3-carboxypropyl)histidine synthase